MEYYRILGVSPGATSAEIKKAYHRLAVKYHPDRNPDPKVASLFKEITEAYNTLGDDENRRLYDLRFTTTFNDVFNEREPVKQQDPRYRRKRPENYPPPKKKTTQYDLMKQYLPRLLWVKRVAFIFVVLLAIDFFIPLSEKDEKIVDGYSVYGANKKIHKHDIRITDRNTKLKFAIEEIRYFEPGDIVVIERTFIFSTIRYVFNPAKSFSVERLGIYGPVVFIPGLLLLSSFFGLLYKHRVELSFSMGVASCTLFVISLLLIYLL